jgi:hypothetical protein
VLYIYSYTDIQAIHLKLFFNFTAYQRQWVFKDVQHGSRLSGLTVRGTVGPLAVVGRKDLQSQSQSQFTTDSPSVSMSWCRAPSGAHDQIVSDCLTVAVLSRSCALSYER